MLFIQLLYLSILFALLESCNALSLPTSKSPTPLLSRSRHTVSRDSARPHAYCTKDPTWADPAFTDPKLYITSCLEAIKQSRVIVRLHDHHFNNLDEAVVDFVPGQYQVFHGPLRLPLFFRHPLEPPDPPRPTCSVIIAFLGALGQDFVIPGKSPGPFDLRDSMTLRETLSATATPYLECLRRGAHGLEVGDPAFGWAAMGRGNIGVFFVGANSEMARRLTERNGTRHG